MRVERWELICAFRCGFPPSVQGFDQRAEVGLGWGDGWIEPAKRCRVDLILVDRDHRNPSSYFLQSRGSEEVKVTSERELFKELKLLELRSLYYQPQSRILSWWSQ